MEKKRQEERERERESETQGLKMIRESMKDVELRVVMLAAQRDWKRKTERKNKEIKDKTMNEYRASERARARAAFMVMFLGSLVFCASAVGGLIIVGQMLKEYGSCTLLS